MDSGGLAGMERALACGMERALACGNDRPTAWQRARNHSPDRLRYWRPLRSEKGSREHYTSLASALSSCS
jgi:hypothetical protein